MVVYKDVGIIKPTISSYIWEIKNFCMPCKNTGDKLFSPFFSTMCSTTEHKWRLQILPKGDNECNKDTIWIYLKYLGENSVHANATLSLLDDKCSKVVEQNFQKLFEKDTSGDYLPLEKQNFFTDKRNQVLVNDTINILCEIIHNSDLATPLKKICTEENLPDYCRLQEFDKFEKLLDAENSADVTIRMGKDEMKVHKAIIMGRSPVFQAMFEHDMKEKDDNVVEIADIEYGIMKEVMRFIYVGKVNEIENIASDLLIAADKYSIEGLKILSERQLSNNLTETNAIDYLKLADLCNAINLKSKVIKFLVDKSRDEQKDVIKKSEFKLLPKELMYEVMCAIVEDNSSK